MTSCEWLPTRASRRRVDLRALFRPGIRRAREGVTPAMRPCPLVRFCSLGLCSVDLHDAMNIVSALDLVAPPLRVLRRDDPQRLRSPA